MESHKVIKLKRKNFQVGEPFNPYGLFVGSFIPQWLEVRQEISPGAKLAYARMCRHAGEKGECRPNQNLLAAEIGLKKRQTQTYIQELDENRLIRSQRRGQGRSNTYDFLIHEWMFDNVIDVQDAAYQSQLDVQDAALLDVQDAAHPYPYKKRIKEENQFAPKDGAIKSPLEYQSQKQSFAKYKSEWNQWRVERGEKILTDALGEKPIFNGKDVSAFCQLRENGKTISEITERFTIFCRTPNKWYAEKGYAFNVFAENYSSFGAKMQQIKNITANGKPNGKSEVKITSAPAAAYFKPDNQKPRSQKEIDQENIEIQKAISAMKNKFNSEGSDVSAGIAA